MSENEPTAGEARNTAFRKRSGSSVTARIARAILRHDDTGLFADFPNHFGDKSKGPISLNFLLPLDSELRDALAEGYVMHCLKRVKSADRRYVLSHRLKNGLVTYLAQPYLEATTLRDINEDFLQRFKRWVDSPDRPRATSKPLMRAEVLAAVQLPLAQLQASKEWKARLSPSLRLIASPYPKAHRSIDHNKALSEPEHERLYVGAANDVRDITARLNRQWTAMARIDGAEISIVDAGQSPEACAAWLDANFEHPVPTWYEQGQLNVAYQQCISKAVQNAAERILYPDINEIVPMLVVVCAFFALNPSLTFKLRKDGSDYAFKSLGDVERLHMYPHKERAGLRQRNVLTVTAHPDNPGQILKYLERRTLRLGLMRPELADRAFAHFSFRVRRAVALNVSDLCWKSALKRFADRHGLPEFTLAQLRPTTLDLVHELSGGNIIAMQAVAMHTDAQTTYTYYTSDAQLRRNRERLGEMQMQMERWAFTGGKIRPEDRPHGLADQGAATPGFTCLDPKDSPIPGEVRGELCTAYGRCPECPLALVDPTSPRALAYLVMLNERITEAHERMADPSAWHLRWAPVQEELLTYWLAGWDPGIAEKSRTIPIPELPHVE